MSTERLGDRSIEVMVPEELFRELLPEGGKIDAITEYILEVNSEDAAGAFLAEGTLDTGDKVQVTFVPVRGMPKDVNSRLVKYTQIIRNSRGEVVDILEETGDIDWIPNHNN